MAWVYRNTGAPQHRCTTTTRIHHIVDPRCSAAGLGTTTRAESAWVCLALGGSQAGQQTVILASQNLQRPQLCSVGPRTRPAGHHHVKTLQPRARLFLPAQHSIEAWLQLHSGPRQSQSFHRRALYSVTVYLRQIATCPASLYWPCKWNRPLCALLGPWVRSGERHCEDLFHLPSGESGEVQSRGRFVWFQGTSAPC